MSYSSKSQRLLFEGVFFLYFSFSLSLCLHLSFCWSCHVLITLCEPLKSHKCLGSLYLFQNKKWVTEWFSQSVTLSHIELKNWQYLCCPTLGKIAMIFSSPPSKAAPLCLAKRWISRQLAGDKLSFWESSQTIQCPPTILEEITDFSAKIFFPTPSFMSSWDDNDQMADKPQWGEISAKQQQRVSHRVQNKGLFISRYLPCVRLN